MGPSSFIKGTRDPLDSKQGKYIMKGADGKGGHKNVFRHGQSSAMPAWVRIKEFKFFILF
jgi:hypothetical protein